MRLPRPQSTLGAIVELLAIVAFAVGLALLIQAFVVKPYVIPSGSMIPTLEKGQRVLVERVSYQFTDPKIGDIVVFHPPEGAQTERCGDSGFSPPLDRSASRPPASTRATTSSSGSSRPPETR